MTTEATGTVVKINEDKGYGFIRRPNGRDVFFHVTALENDLPFDVTLMQRSVTFDVEEGCDGRPHAVNIKAGR